MKSADVREEGGKLLDLCLNDGYSFTIISRWNIYYGWISDVSKVAHILVGKRRGLRPGLCTSKSLPK